MPKRTRAMAPEVFVALVKRIYPEQGMFEAAATDLGMTKRMIYAYADGTYPVSLIVARVLTELAATEIACAWMRKNPNRTSAVPSLRQFYQGDRVLPEEIKVPIANRVVSIIQRCGYGPRQQI